MENIINIEKENLTGLKFSLSEVLNNELLIAKRTYNIEKAVRLGNLYKGKVKIKFRNFGNELMSVNTTIWAWGSDYISLKGGKSIPVKAIEEIQF